MPTSRKRKKAEGIYVTPVHKAIRTVTAVCLVLQGMRTARGPLTHPEPSQADKSEIYDALSYPSLVN